MSLTIELRGKTNAAWPFMSPCGSQIGRLSTGSTKRDVELVFGTENDGPGVMRAVNRITLLHSIENLLRATKSLPVGFQLRLPPYERLKIPERIGKGQGNALVDGRYCEIRCIDDHWRIVPVDHLAAVNASGQYTKHYEPAEIATENWGVIRVEPRKRGGRDLAWLLRQIKKFLEADPSEKVTIIWG